MQEALKEPARRVVGARQVLRAMQAGQLAAVFIARDADPFVTKPIMDACERHGVRLVEVDSMKALGASCQIDVKASVAGAKKA